MDHERMDAVQVYLVKILLLLLVTLVLGSCAAGFAVGGGAAIRINSDNNVMVRIFTLDFDFD